MTQPQAEVVQVLGRARSGDPVTATALALRSRLSRLGHQGRVVAAHPDGDRAVERYDPADPGRLVVHSVDGGEDLADLVGDLAGRPLTLVHHGSAVGSHRRCLRALRDSARRAVAADPAAREELRGLGFRRVGLLPSWAADGAFLDVVADEVTADNLARHPGPLLLCIGPVTPNRGLEELLDAFADLITHSHPAAVLSLCGPSPAWYHAHLHRYLIGRGLLACEIVEPARDAEVVARLDRADAVVSLRPAGLDPYLRAAMQRGVPIVAPLSGTVAGVDPAALVPGAPSAGTAALAAALGDALERPRTNLHPAPPAGDAELLRALGLA